VKRNDPAAWSDCSNDVAPRRRKATKAKFKPKPDVIFPFRSKFLRSQTFALTFPAQKRSEVKIQSGSRLRTQPSSLMATWKGFSFTRAPASVQLRWRSIYVFFPRVRHSVSFCGLRGLVSDKQRVRVIGWYDTLDNTANYAKSTMCLMPIQGSQHQIF